MTWLDKLERRLGFLGIPGLIRIVVALTALVFLLVRLNPGFGLMLDLDPATDSSRRNLATGHLYFSTARIGSFFWQPLCSSPMVSLVHR